MKRIVATLAALGAFSAVAFSSRDAHALGPVDVEIGAKVGGATNPADAPASNPLGVGVGARGGVSIFNFYGGLNAMYYLGSTDELASIKVSTHAFQLGIEAGYGFTFSLLTVRPQLGLGNINFGGSVEGTAAGVTVTPDSSNHFYLEPGITALIGLGIWYVGADANVLVIPGVDQAGGDSKTFTSFTMHGQLGFKL